jgi:hypothetical protein
MNRSIPDLLMVFAPIPPWRDGPTGCIHHTTECSGCRPGLVAETGATSGQSMTVPEEEQVAIQA